LGSINRTPPAMTGDPHTIISLILTATLMLSICRWR